MSQAASSSRTSGKSRADQAVHWRANNGDNAPAAAPAPSTAQSSQASASSTLPAAAPNAAPAAAPAPLAPTNRGANGKGKGKGQAYGQVGAQNAALAAAPVPATVQPGQVNAKPAKSRPRGPCPRVVPPHLWEQAQDQAPQIDGNVQWVLRQRGDIGVVHDARVPRHLTTRVVHAAPGLLIRRPREGVNMAHESQWRNGICVRPHSTPGKWYILFEDTEQEEVVNCGCNDLYGAYPLAPTKCGLLEVNSEDGTEMLCCQNPLSGDYYTDTAGEIIELKLVDLRVIEAREKFEQHCGHPNGLILMTPGPSSRPLDPIEDHHTVEEALSCSQEQVMSEENRSCLELWHIKVDGTRSLFWHSGSLEPEQRLAPPARGSQALSFQG